MPAASTSDTTPQLTRRELAILRLPAGGHTASTPSTGAVPWSQRPQAELRATGETVRRDIEAVQRLAPQELQVALVVGRGASNREAAAAIRPSNTT